ncbi:DUF5776 domain-containing protein [Bacillus coahuilensis]|uniref:DUF5776 domain-containing protein n=1 Tax=Bacillus coahuilensis TaxID=408580 RepID=UPI0001850924|nr:DUF5776 domain-containing protein [Bacillus coahuilensis]
MKRSGNFIEMDRKEFFEWLINEKVTRKITHTQEHHTYQPDYDDCGRYSNLQLVLNMSNYHRNTRGWSAIAQHITTFKDGKIVVGERSFNSNPAGIAGHNSGGICMEHVGYFDKGKDSMTEEHKKTIAFVTAALHFKFNLPVNTQTCVYHTWFASKTCPGTNFFGGNTKADAIKYFYPVVEKELAAMKGVSYKPTSAPAPKPAPTSSKVNSSVTHIEVITASLWTYNSPDWDDKAIVVNDGEVFTVTEKIKVGGGYMYKLKSGLYITANEKYVKPTTLKKQSVEKKKELVEVTVNSLWTYASKDWDDKELIVHKGEVFTIVGTYKVGGGTMYKLKSGLYITANTKYVRKLK